MNKSRIILLCILSVLTFMNISAKNRGFAIFIDPISYKKVRPEVEQYAQSIEKQGLKTFIIEDKWGIPDSIRACILQLYTQKNYPIEGAVFIGDIPIPMIRDAQHMTTAFKVNQNLKNFERTAVPSDRFYDDLNLKFTFIHNPVI